MRALGVFEESEVFAIDSAKLVQNGVAHAAAIGAQRSRSRRLGFERARSNFRYDSHADGCLDSKVMRETVFEVSLVMVHQMLGSQLRARTQIVGIEPSYDTTNRHPRHLF